MNIRFERLIKAAPGYYSLIPNLNRTGIELPDQAGGMDLKQSVKLDKDLQVRKLSDREIYSLFIEPSEAELKALKRLNLLLSFNPKLYTVMDQSGKALPNNNGMVLIDLEAADKHKTKIGGIQVYLEARSFTGSPGAAESDALNVQFALLAEDGELLWGTETIEGATIRPADLVLIGDAAPPERMLICELAENKPSVIEVREAARQAGVPLTVVPQTMGMGDTWLQDQFQVAYALAGRNKMQMILHLPRVLNAGSLFPTTPNLKSFVEHYFPSQSVGLFNEFWEQMIPISDGHRENVELNITESFLLYKNLLFPGQLLRYIFKQIGAIDPVQKSAFDDFKFDNLYNVRLEIPSSYMKLSAYTNVSEEIRAGITSLRGVIDKLSSLEAGNIAGLAATGQVVELTVLVKGRPETFLYNEENFAALNDLFKQLNNLHSPGNYGGNIEVSPPMGGLPYGKILTGTVYSDEIKALLNSCGPQQPLAEAYTAWLKVGHIDELMCFVKDSSASQGFSICRVSPRLAVGLLEALQEAQLKGTLVTRMLRGKKWTHEAVANERYSKLPPSMYLEYIKNEDERYDLSGFIRPIPPETQTTYYDSVYQDDRRFMVFGSARNIVANYAAFITCADMLRLVKVTNRAAEDFFLTGKLNFADDVPFAHYAVSERYKKNVAPGILDKVLAKEFPAVPVYQLPVLFDRLDNFGLSETSAVTPDLVNLQTLNEHVLVPRPYGPRMRPAEAVTFLVQFTEQHMDGKLVSYARRTLSEKWIHSQELDVTYHWIKAGEKVAVANPGRRPTPLELEFNEMWVALHHSIHTSTPTFEIPSYYEVIHRNSPYINHPIVVDEDLGYVANCFKDGFDELKNYPVDYCKGDDEKSHPKQDAYDAAISDVMDKISEANPGIFDDEGQITAKDWTRIIIPENTVDIFQLYAHLVLTMLGVRVQWVDSWYYHDHDGGIHCGTNVLRRY